MSDRRTTDELQEEMADVADLFDPEFYAATNPTVAVRTDDLLRHFCVHGWRELRKPRRDFDVWWYWANHLDPAADDLNPLVHFARSGRAAGLSTRPSPLVTGHETVPFADRPVRRACLFAGFDADGIVDEAALIYLRDLARFTDVFCLYDCYLPETELAKLREVAVEAWAIRHGAYDFGSYSMLASELVGWDRLGSYDEVLFVNDSCYLLRPLDEVFARMGAEACDWWGLQATKGIALTRDAPGNQFPEPIPLEIVRANLLASFEDDAIYDFLVGSYFLAFRRPVLDDQVFRTIVESVAPQGSKLAIIQKYEIGLTHVLIGRGHAFSTFIPALYPFHPIFTEWAFALIEQGFPLLKRYFLYQNHYDTPGLARWKERILSLLPDAPVEVFDQNLGRTSPADLLHRSYSIELDDDGAVRVPRILSGEDFVRADKAAPKRDDWWVFAVDPQTHLLPENSRAVFDQLANDPAITKIILTRSRHLELAGANVVSEPLLSREGRDFLLGAGVVLVPDDPLTALGVRADVTSRQVIAVRSGLRLLKHGRTAASPRHPGTVPPPPAEGGMKLLHKLPKPVVTAVLTASDVDHVAEISSQWPARYSSGWRTGIPAHDHLLARALPPDLADQDGRLRDLTDDRRLVLFAPTARPTGAASPYRFRQAEIERLSSWARDHDAVIGVREPLADLERPYASAFADLALDVSARRFPSTATVLRSTSVLVTDYDGCALDFTVTSRPVIAFAHDLDTFADRLLYDLDHMFPGQVCRDFDDLIKTLETVFARPPAPIARQYERVRSLMIDHLDGMNSSRVIDGILKLLVGMRR